jgi:chorismate dehydratase
MRIGAVSYLNTEPLVHGLQQRLPQAQLSFDLPSRLADDLAAGTIDVALIPSIEFLRNPAYTVVSDACIGCHGPVLSVKLFTKGPIEKITTLALDEGSRTSAALVQIMLAHLHDIHPHLTALPIGCGLDDARTDAVLLIGDRAIEATTSEYRPIWDLGEVWVRTFERPFVFAVWAARNDIQARLGDAALSEVTLALSAARDEGVRHIDQIAESQQKIIGLSVPQCVHYLRDNLHFTLQARELEGLDLFRRKALRLGLLENDTPIRIYDCETA